MKKIALLGSTGSIGVNVLNIVREFPEQFCIVGLAAGRNIELLSRQAKEFKPDIISVIDEEHAEALSPLLPNSLNDRIVWGNEGNELVGAMDVANFTVSAIVGAAVKSDEQ